MYLSHLSLTHFRNYQKLEIDFSGPLTLFQGENAQGKTNLLEAVYYLATSKPVHAQTEREIVDWLAEDEPIPFCRVAASVITGESSRPLELEIILSQRGEGGTFQKQIKINGSSKRNLDLVGQMRAVLFLPEDIKLVDGSPGERRRYLDIALCQISRPYTRALSQFQKVMTHRNSLLKTLREQNARASDPSVESQLAFWDQQLTTHGSTVLTGRRHFVQQLEQIARRRHLELSHEREELTLQYLPSFNLGDLSEADYLRLKENRLDLVQSVAAAPELTVEQVQQRFTEKLASRRSREIAAGTTLYGPHRDDLRFLANGRDLRTYGSRGQQRTAALSLKLAEVQAMTEATGAAPLLLLDDVMSELDAVRRATLLTALEGVPQALLTTTDWEDFTPEFRARAQLFTVSKGTVNSV